MDGFEGAESGESVLANLRGVSMRERQHRTRALLTSPSQSLTARNERPASPGNLSRPPCFFRVADAWNAMRACLILHGGCLTPTGSGHAAPHGLGRHYNS